MTDRRLVCVSCTCTKIIRGDTVRGNRDCALDDLRVARLPDYVLRPIPARARPAYLFPSPRSHIWQRGTPALSISARIALG